MADNNSDAAMQKALQDLAGSLSLQPVCAQLSEFASRTPEERQIHAVVDFLKNGGEVDSMTPEQRVGLWQAFSDRPGTAYTKTIVSGSGSNYVVNISRENAEGNITDQHNRPLTGENAAGLRIAVYDKTAGVDYGSVFLSREQIHRDMQDISKGLQECRQHNML